MPNYLLSPRTYTETIETNRRVLGDAGRTGTGSAGSSGWGENRYVGKLTQDLDAPTDGMASPTTATVKVWLPDPASTADPCAFIESNLDEITAVNRDPSRSGVIGGWCKIEFLNGEWSFYDVECP